MRESADALASKGGRDGLIDGSGSKVVARECVTLHCDFENRRASFGFVFDFCRT